MTYPIAEDDQDETVEKIPNKVIKDRRLNIEENNNNEEELNNHNTIRLMIQELKNEGQFRRSDRDQPEIRKRPIWLNEDLFNNAKSVYARHFMGCNFAHLSGLLLLVRVNSIYKTLSETGHSDSVAKLFRRYYNTIKHVKTWYEGDIFEENSEAFKSLLMVRGMHNKVSSRFNDNLCNKNGFKNDERHKYNSIVNFDQHENQPTTEAALMNGDSKIKPSNNISSVVHISEYDIMITQFAFIGFIVTNPKDIGLIEEFSDKDLESLLHFWRVIGYYLGASDKYNLCSHDIETVKKFCNCLIELEYKESLLKNPLKEASGIMSVNIVRSIKFIPMLTVYGILRHLYEILEHDVTELEDRRGWYSNLSYSLIKLVMTRLLAYRPFRAFNNGLTRLSLYLVGKVDDWFFNRLEAKFGQELRI